MRANYEQLVKAHQRAPQVQEDLVPDEVKFQVHLIIINALILLKQFLGFPNLYGLSIPIFQSASEYEQLC